MGELVGSIPTSGSMVKATCPTCGEAFESMHGMKIHHKQEHGESLATDNDRDGILSKVNDEDE